jgi:hypothetical protein
VESLQTKIILFIVILLPFLILGQSYNYTYVDPCTNVSKRVTVPFTGGVVVNYFGNVQTFTSNDFSTGGFDTWIQQLSQINSATPCQEITTIVVNNISNITTANTLTIVTNMIAVTSVAQNLASITGSSVMSASQGISSISQQPQSDNSPSESTPSSTEQNNQQPNNTSQQNTSSGGTTNQQGSTQGQSSSSTSSINSSEQGGSQAQNSSPDNTPQQNDQGTTSSESSSSSGGLANSVSNVMEGSSSGDGKKSNAATKNVGSLIASGDIVAIANTDQTENVRVVGSITHANTRGTRIKGVLFNYTTGINNLNVTFYKSWINKSKKLNTVGAQSFMMDFDRNFFSTTTVLESYKVNNKVTGMFGLNFTAGKMGQRSLLNLSAVGGGHTGFKVSKRIDTSILLLGVYSPFTQFYEGQWWDAGVLVVPFSSWDIKITKTFKFNISFTGVYQSGESFLNYQILTGGKLNF